MTSSVDDMLKAPALTEEQSEIIQVLNSVNSDNTVLCYPRAGENLSPIFFEDIDSDGDTEAIALFYSSEQDNIFVNIAVMDQGPESWEVTTVTKGTGTQIWSIESFRLTESDVYLLVEWANNSYDAGRITIYHYSDEGLIAGFEDNTLITYINDINGDEISDFCYVSSPSTSETQGYVLNIIYGTENGLQQTATFILQSEVLAVESIYNGMLTDGTYALVVDEDLGEGYYGSEIFTVTAEEVSKAEMIGGYSIDQITRRTSDILTEEYSEDSDYLLVPSSTPPNDEIAYPALWTYLYGFGEDTIDCKRIIYVDNEYRFIVCFPQYWYETLLLTVSDDGPYRLIAVDSTTGMIRYQFHILTIGESDEALLEEGFTYKSSNGMYRYYFLSNCQSFDNTYIQNHFRTY